MSWKRNVATRGILATLILALSSETSFAAQQTPWPFPSCPEPLLISAWSASEAPTRAIAAQQWFALLQKKVPTVTTPRVLMTLPPNEAVTVCRIATSGAVTDNLGRAANVAVIVVSKTATEEVARFDAREYEIYLPPGGMAEVGPGFQLSPFGPDWPLARIGRTTDSDAILLNRLTTSVFSNGREIIGFRFYSPAQPGLGRTDSLLLGDRCGSVSVQVRVSESVLTLAGGMVAPPPCSAGDVRSLLATRPRVSVTDAGLTMTADGASVTIPLARSQPFRRLLLRSVRTRSRSSTKATEVRVGVGPGLVSFGGSDGCNAVGSAAAFAAGRFVLDPLVERNMMGCPGNPHNALSLLMVTGDNTGSYVHSGNVLTLRSVAGTVAVLKVL